MGTHTCCTYTLLYIYVLLGNLHPGAPQGQALDGVKKGRQAKHRPCQAQHLGTIDPGVLNHHMCSQSRQMGQQRGTKDLSGV